LESMVLADTVSVELKVVDDSTGVEAGDEGGAEADAAAETSDEV
jgi:hypothetical protein